MSHHDDHHDHDTDGFAELLDLDAEVFAPALQAVYEDIERAADSPVGSILDLGAGSGTGTFGLLRHFGAAQAIAVDSSADMLAHLEQRAEHLGLSDRVSTRCSDLDEGVPVVTPVDLVWASASLHHLADPDQTLVQIARTIRPGGLLTVAELTGFPQFVPDDAPGGKAEARAHALLTEDRAVDMPAMGSDWGQRLVRAGLVIEQHRAISLDVAPPEQPVVGRYAAAVLTAVRRDAADRLAPADRAALDELLDGGSNDVRSRTDLHVSAERWLWIARQPI